ncbi:unnamed protein product [Rotaria sordida]|uniref:Transposase n=1 Tax=Rotaria sordida TaxID=392033 RepID=A0A815GQU3_9BILA|nr:unnamed protein product [Rotaria sordida]CAF1343531.1 unnamed protein product [Rotaria sordida]
MSLVTQILSRTFFYWLQGMFSICCYYYLWYSGVISNIQFVENIHSNIMDDCECLLLDSNNQPSSCTQPKYTIVEKKSKAICWSTFGLPAKIIGPNKYEIIKNFASCKSCFQTYSYSSSTTTMSNHKCLILSNKNQSKIEPIPLIKSNSSTLNSDTTTTRDRTNSVNCKSLQKHKCLITSAISDWVCSNTRPINIVEDIGLKDLIEQCIKTGFDCGPVSASSILPSARERCLTLSPDLWSDRYKKTSYLGCTAHWVDSLWNLYSFKLFCLPYRQSNKTGASVLKALEEGLSIYDLVPFMSDIIWVCDGGSNLLKALEKFTVVRCTAHLLNNCLQTIFFQTNALKFKKHILFSDHFYDKSEDEGDLDSNSEDEQNEDAFDDDEINDQQKACIKYNSTVSNKKANAISLISQLSTDAKRILITIV